MLTHTMQRSQTRTVGALSSAVRGAVLPCVHLSQNISPQFLQWCCQTKKRYQWFMLFHQDRLQVNATNIALAGTHPTHKCRKISATRCTLGNCFIRHLKSWIEKNRIRWKWQLVEMVWPIHTGFTDYVKHSPIISKLT